MTKLFIQIPCYNERDHLPATLADLPRQIDGVESIEVLVIDDGSTDGTSDVAKNLGVHHVLRFPKNRGLAAAYTAGVDACVRLGADIIVNTDADNQYRGDDIGKLVAPIVAGRADMVVGDRQIHTIKHFSALKKFLQRFGSRVVRTYSGTEVIDTTSGFRAISASAARRLFVHNSFTYTLESVIQAGHSGIVIENAAIRTNDQTRESRLFSSIPNYLRRNGVVIIRSYVMYKPLRTFAAVTLLLFLFGLSLGARFLYLHVVEHGASGHVQSLVVGVGAVVISFLVGMMALLADLIASNRRISEDVLQRLKRVEAQLASDRPCAIEGVDSTGAEPWLPGGDP